MSFDQSRRRRRFKITAPKASEPRIAALVVGSGMAEIVRLLVELVKR